MLKHFYSNLSVKKFRYIVLVLSVVFLSLALLLYFRNRYVFENLLFQETEQRQLVIAKSGALSINLFIENADEDIRAISRLPEIYTLNVPSAEKTISGYLSGSTLSAISTIGLLDKNGKALVIYDRTGMASQVGQNFSDRDYFKWSEQPSSRGQTYITQPFVSRAGSTKGSNVIVVSSPVYNGNLYTGDLIFVISLDEFTKSFVSPLRINKGEVFLMDENGRYIAGDNNLINVNLFNYADSNKWNNYKSFKDGLYEVVQSGNGIEKWDFKEPEKSSSETDLVGYQTIQRPGPDWYLVAAVPESSELSVINDFYFNQRIIAIYLILVFLAFAITYITRDSISRKEFFMEGYKRAKRDKD